jgi:hypothetical protein
MASFTVAFRSAEAGATEAEERADGTIPSHEIKERNNQKRELE